MIAKNVDHPNQCKFCVAGKQRMTCAYTGEKLPVLQFCAAGGLTKEGWENEIENSRGTIRYSGYVECLRNALSPSGYLHNRTYPMRSDFL